MFRMEAISDLFGTLFEVWKEMFLAFFSIIPKAISFVLWIAVAAIILPCVYIAHEIYPKWSEWGDGF